VRPHRGAQPHRRAMKWTRADPTFLVLSLVVLAATAPWRTQALEVLEFGVLRGGEVVNAGQYTEYLIVVPQKLDSGGAQVLQSLVRRDFLHRFTPLKKCLSPTRAVQPPPALQTFHSHVMFHFHPPHALRCTAGLALLAGHRTH